MHWVIGEVGAKLLKAHAETQLLGNGAKTLTRGICFTDTDQHFDNTSNTHHAAVNTFGDILFKGALRDVSRLGFEGIIKVDHGAQKTDSYLTMNTLFLSEGARASSIPGLEILADDVRCSHGATVGHGAGRAGLLPDVSRHRPHRGGKADRGRLLRACHSRDAARVGPPAPARYCAGEGGFAQGWEGSAKARRGVSSGPHREVR